MSQKKHSLGHVQMYLHESSSANLDAKDSLEQSGLALEVELQTMQQDQENVLMAIAATGCLEETMLQKSLQEVLGK